MTCVMKNLCKFFHIVCSKRKSKIFCCCNINDRVSLPYCRRDSFTIFFSFKSRIDFIQLSNVISIIIVAYSGGHKNARSERRCRKLTRACALCEVVYCSNRYLALD